MSVADDLKTVADDLTTLQGVVAQAVTDLNVPATESVGDTFLAASVAALEAAGYTVTAPETETPAEDSTDPSTES
jgi:hypothetical protein